MTIYLKQNTASQEVPLGPFLDSTDGNTEETGLTIANTNIKIWKAGATTLANKNSGGATHISNGIYYAVLDATDTNTLGSLVIFVHVSGALVVRLECCVLAANIYDSMIGGGDILDVSVIQMNGTTLSTTSAQIGVNVVQISQDATAADNLESYCDGTTPMPVNAIQVSGDATAADNLEAAYDGAGYAGGTIKPDVNIVQVNGTTVTGDGDSTPWGPA
jgi:hypothetical protein